MKTANIPEISNSATFKFRSYISQIKDDGLSTKNKILFCHLYQSAESSTQKFLAKQNIQTNYTLKTTIEK